MKTCCINAETLRSRQGQKVEHVCGKTKLLSLVIFSSSLLVSSPALDPTFPASISQHAHLLTHQHGSNDDRHPRPRRVRLPTSSLFASHGSVHQAGIDLTHLLLLSVRPGYNGFSFLPPDWLCVASVISDVGASLRKDCVFFVRVAFVLHGPRIRMWSKEMVSNMSTVNLTYIVRCKQHVFWYLEALHVLFKTLRERW